MLAPLEDRSVLLGDEADDAREIRELRQALRESRRRLRRSALLGARQTAALSAEIARLQQMNARQARQIERYAAGAVVVDLGRKLMALAEANERLVGDSRRAAMLERVLGIAEAERLRLARERDALALELCRYRHDALLGVSPAEGGDAGRSA